MLRQTTRELYTDVSGEETYQQRDQLCQHLRLRTVFAMPSWERGGGYESQLPQDNCLMHS
jgi:hypothetical protein